MNKIILSLFLFIYFNICLFSIENINLSVKKIILENGLTVFLNEDHNKPEIYGAITVKSGSKYEKSDATGMAHYLEHMLFKGTDKLGTANYQKEKDYLDEIEKLYDKLAKTSDKKEKQKIQVEINNLAVETAKFAIPNEFDKLMDSIGSKDVNAYTDYDVVVFHNYFPPHQIEKWLDIYTERFRNPVFRLFQSELETVYEEKNMYNDDFKSLIVEEYLKNFYKKHPYGRSIIGLTEHLKNPSLSKMKEFYNTYFVANNIALILCGDFDTEKIIPIIKEKFGKLKSDDLPKEIEYKEDDFKGREFVKKRLSPINVGGIGFRVPAYKNEDTPVIQVINSLLSNDNQTGLLDKLKLENKLFYVFPILYQLKDTGGSFFAFIPNIFGGSLPKAEKMVLNEIENIKKGNFSDELLEGVKNKFIVDFEMFLENNERKAYIISDSFIHNIKIEEMVKFPQIVEKITKEDIKRVANQYYNNNYLAFYSEIGFPKKEKLQKPDYKPVIASKKDEKSEYAKYFESIPTIKPEFKFIDFEKDIEQKEIKQNVNLYLTKNPINNIFSLEIIYNVGIAKFQDLDLIYVFNNIGTTNIKSQEFKNKMSLLGCTYHFWSSLNNVNIYISCPDKNFNKTLKLINELVKNPKIEKQNLKKLVDDRNANLKTIKEEPQRLAYYLFNYSMYKERSYFKKYRKTLIELYQAKDKDVIKALNDAKKYQIDIHYAGTKNFNEVKDEILNNYQIDDDIIKVDNPFIIQKENYTENIIFFLDKRNALQSNIYFYIKGQKNENIKNSPYENAFNTYFGRGMSSLVFQEIREFRSLAYSSDGGYYSSYLKDDEAIFYGYIGTQADKTLEAIDTMTNLINNMPKKEERLNLIKETLIQNIYTDRDDFRYLSKTIKNLKKIGFTEDPNIFNLEVYNKLNFNDIANFYDKRIKNKPIAISIVGDKTKIDMKKLSKFGKIIFVNEWDIYN
ncbi:MAG: hypothetical protein A2Z98_12335 [Spirochaetes bacterium GWB1_27_13]|nr:MAG: hypothetical protein A2Z98_12335 [Spirochaetes bacterium GWB1_27_13]